MSQTLGFGLILSPSLWLNVHSHSNQEGAVEEGCHSIHTLVGWLGSSLWERILGILVRAVFDRVFWPFRLDCKLPRGRDQVVGFPLGFLHMAKLRMAGHFE